MALPIYEMVIDPAMTSDVEVSFVALVDKPAIERNFLAFNSQRLSFAIDEEKRIISGPAMVADSLIYRKDDQGEYNVFFSAPTIRQIAQKFFKKDYHKNLNLFHDPTLSLEDVTIFESFVTDASRGIQPMKGFEDLPDGSWFISAKIDNEAVWAKIKSGEVKGFSVEGIFSYMKKSQNGTVLNNSHLQDINLTFMGNVKQSWEDFKTKFQKFLGEIPAPAANAAGVPTPAAATPAPNTLAKDFTLKDGTAVSVDKLEVGGVLMINGAPAPVGEHELADGTKVTVGEGGVISAVTPSAAVPNPPNFSEQFKTLETKFTAFDLKIASYEQKFKEQGEAFTSLTNSFNKSNEMLIGLVGLVKQLAEAPQADPVGDNSKNFASQKADTKKERLAAFTQAFTKLRENKN